MEFRPCIDIHNGSVKQIVGSSLKDLEAGLETNTAADRIVTNFVATQDAAYFAELYRELGLSGGHIIILNSSSSDYYEKSLAQAENALKAYPGGFMVGGGINHHNAEYFINAGASHVIVTSYVFEDGKINYHNLNKLINIIGREKIVLDLSCRKSKGNISSKRQSLNNGRYFIVTDRWQKYTDVKVDINSLTELAPYCDEFLIHAVDVEGKSAGIDEDLVRILGEYQGIPITYAGGVHDFSDLEKLSILGRNRLNVTIGSALDLFGGPMKVTEVIQFFDKVSKADKDISQSP
ncbi:MAG: phosphoribosylformimino-5-aminoimidazole carboxamide ribotide isomerase [Lachnospiraceae bacterium]|nr:phosphoribosylformimino-5-aminoimidazole carboxamide ribotide isomerase [Lachnospiraceae bacterium]